MTRSHGFLFAALGTLALAAGCAGTTLPGAAPRTQAISTQSRRAHQVIPSVTPQPKHLYVEHNGRFFVYSLPLGPNSKPSVSLNEAPSGGLPPVMTADAYGHVALGFPNEVLFFKPPFHSFEPSQAYLQLPLTPAITQIGTNGAVLADIEFDPDGDFWLLNNVGGAVNMLPYPITKHSVSTLTIGFGVPGTKTSAYGELVAARFDVVASLYVYASQVTGTGALLFKTPYPWGKPPSPYNGLNLNVPYFVDPSQYVNGPPSAYTGGIVYGQYQGPLATPPPQQPPPVPVNALAQFQPPFLDVVVLPNATVDEIAGATVGDANRYELYVLDAQTGKLKVYPMPFANHAPPKFVLPCAAARAAYCSEKPEHLFLAP